jgi:hypothetical protein
MRKNQPPAQLIMLFQIKLMAPEGSSSHFRRNQRLKRKVALASRKSLPMVVSD